VIAINPNAHAEAAERDSERRQGALRGPLHGIPILIKDNIETADPVPTTAGSLALKENLTGRDAPCVARLRAAGAVILGKANLSEWANFRSNRSVSGWSSVGGLVRNPHVLDRSCSGSSSGCGAAVAAGLAAAAIGTETDGSIVSPSEVCGVVGMKPTVGLVSRTHVVPISRSQDTPGPMTRSVADAAMILAVMVGRDPADRATASADKHRNDHGIALPTDALNGARLGVWRPRRASPATLCVFERALEALRAQGADLITLAASHWPKKIGALEIQVMLTEFKAGLNFYLATTPQAVKTRTLADLISFNRGETRELALFGQELFEAAELTHGLNEPAYRTALRNSRRMARRMPQQPLEFKGIFEQFRVLLALSPEPRLHFQRVPERKITALFRRGIEFDDAIGFGEGQSEYSAHIADRLLPLKRAKSNDLCYPMVAILVTHVVEYLVTALEAEVDIDVWHRATAWIEPSLEQELMLDRVDLCNPQSIGNQTANHRPAAWSYRNPHAACMIDEISHNQHVAGKPHFTNDWEFAFQPLTIRSLIETAAARMQFLETISETGADLPFQKLVEIWRRR